MPSIKASAKKHLAKHAKRVVHVAKNHFIPHEGNNHHPHVLHHRVLLGYSVLLILLKTLAVVVAIALPAASVYSSAISVQNILTLTNATRGNIGLTALTLNTKLAYAAQAKAQDMLSKQYFAHTSPSGAKAWDWIKQAGYTYLYAAENLAVHYVSSEDLQEGWMASPSHRANIVNARYQETGIGIVNGTFEGFPSTFVVQMFGTPIEPEPTPTPTPAPTPVVTSTIPTPAPSPAPVTAPKITTTTPKPAPAPVTTAPVVLSATAAAPQVDDSQTRITPKPSAIGVTVAVEYASSVTAHLAGTSVLLTQDTETNTWRGEIPFTPDEFPSSGERITLTVNGTDGSQTTEALAVLAPRASTQEMFVFNEPPVDEMKLFGFITVNNMQDGVKRFYVIFIAALAAALLINILIKKHIQRLSVIAHTGIVLGLAFFLLLL